MGWMKTKEGLWGDATQDIVDKYLENIGFDYKNEDYSDKKLKEFYDKAKCSKVLERKFNVEWRKHNKIKPTRKELRYHIKFGLGITRIRLGSGQEIIRRHPRG